MKISIPALLASLLVGSVLSLQSAEPQTDRQKKLQEIAALDAELKPLRLRAARELEVIAARKEADEALRSYYETLRLKMAQLEPKKRAKINRHVKLRRDVYGGSAGSRAEDFLGASAREKSSKVNSSKTP